MKKLFEKGVLMCAMQTVQINDSVSVKAFTDPRFKTMKISVDLLIPLTMETVSAYAVLPSLVSRASREYPDYTLLSRRLSELYGASMSSHVSKIGSKQILSISVEGIAGKYALNGENLFQEFAGLLFSVLLNPLKESDGNFPEDGFEQERRQILELLDSEFNDKIVYAHQRCEELVFEGKPAGLNRYGSRESVQALNREELAAAWETVLKNAKFEIFVLGNCQPDFALFERAFSGFGAPLSAVKDPLFGHEDVNRVTEEMALSQSKLSLAFRTGAKADERLLYRLMSAVLGGTPSSKFFMNVREKMGLCYYCSSRVDTYQGVLYVESGVETENIEKAEAEILRQVELLQAGELTEEELLFAKLAMCNSCRSVGDSLNAVENWYLSQSLESALQTPEEAVEKIMGFTAEVVIGAAKTLRLDTVYCLKGNGGN